VLQSQSPKRLTSDLGKTSEDYAASYLHKLGYKILTRNFHSKFGPPEEAVTFWKLNKIRKAADYYCLINNIKDRKMRIDVVAMEMEGKEISLVKIINVD
jgi:Holliday junction resolvase-like predicted endonuclease